MPSEQLRNAMEEAQRLRAELRERVKVRRAVADDYKLVLQKRGHRTRLLLMTESLIQAHRIAKIDDNGLTLDLIEDALRHLGERLAKEIKLCPSQPRKPPPSPPKP